MKINSIMNDESVKTPENSIASNLSFLLKKHRLSASQLANDLGLPWMTIKRILAGETMDPRVSTLKLIADYFDVNINFFFVEKITYSTAKVSIVPKLSWENLSLEIIHNIDKNNWEDWQTFTINSIDKIGDRTFAIESRPSMYTRYPKGTIFIIDPDLAPTDGDITMIYFADNKEFALKELFIDPPHWKLLPLFPSSEPVNFNRENQEVMGVSLLTLFYNQNLNRS